MIKIHNLDNKKKTESYIVDFFWAVIQRLLMNTAVKNFEIGL